MGLDLASVRRSEIVFRRVALDCPKFARALEPWIALHAALLDQNAEIQGEFPKLRWLHGRVAETLQQVGLDTFGSQFRYLGYELHSLAHGPRWREGGAVVYVKRPRLRRAHYVIAAAHLPPALVRHRLDTPGLEVLNAGDRFLHEGTQFYNLRASLGAARNFLKNAPQISFCYAQLIEKLAAKGQRALCIIKKCFARHAASLLQRDLRELTGKLFRVVVNPEREEVADPLVVPIINFGTQGLNCYSDFFAAFCLSSFYTREDVIDQRLNEAHAPGEEVPLTFSFEGGRRHAAQRQLLLDGDDN